MLHANFTALSFMEPDLLPTEVLHCGNREFRAFCCCHLDLDPMIIYELDPYPHSSQDTLQTKTEYYAKASSGLGPKIGPGIFQLGQPTQSILTRVLLLIRAPDIDMSEGLKLYCCIFYRLLYFYTAQRPPIKCRFGRRVYSILPLSILHSPHPSPNFYRGSKSVKLGLDLRHHSSLSGTSFRYEATHSCTKVSYLVQRRRNSILPKSGAVWTTHPSDSRV